LFYRYCIRNIQQTKKEKQIGSLYNAVSGFSFRT